MTNLEQARAALLAQRARLWSEVARLVEVERAARASERAGADTVDEASDLMLQDINEALEHSGSRELAEVEAALRRLDDGTYGACEDCAQVIDPARLEARPSARRCLRCQRQAEMRRGSRFARTA
jgi:DnaK suppressor protein